LQNAFYALDLLLLAATLGKMPFYRTL